MSMQPAVKKIYDDGRTKQSFKDETDINIILKRAQKTGTISHLAKYQARYGDFSDFDFFDAQIQIAKGGEIFDELPSEIRNEFQNSAGKFFKYVNDPANKDRLNELLPGLAAPGRQNITTNQNMGADAPSEPEANGQPTSEASPTPTASTPPTAPNASVETPAS